MVTDEVGNPLVVYCGEHGPVQNKIRANGHYGHKDLIHARSGDLSFGGAEDIAIADLRIELLFPADAATRGMMEEMGAPS